MEGRRQFLKSAVAIAAGGSLASRADSADAHAPRVTVVLNGSGPPRKKAGGVGDFYLDRRAHAIYGPKRSHGWGTPTSLVGPPGRSGSGSTGPQGTPGQLGPQGKPGYSVLHGSGPPSVSFGQDNDFYIDTASTQLYGPKSGGVWGSPISLSAVPSSVVNVTSPSAGSSPVWSGSSWTSTLLDTGVLVASPPSGDQTGATDTAILQDLINEVSLQGAYAGHGLAIQLQPGYYIGNVILKPRVRLWGCGWGATRIVGPQGGSQAVVGSDNTKYLTGIELAYLTIDGNNLGWDQSGTVQSTCRGLDFRSDGDPGVGTPPLNTSAYGGAVPMFHDLAILNAGGDGAYLEAPNRVNGRNSGLIALMKGCIIAFSFGNGLNIQGEASMISDVIIDISKGHGVLLGALNSSLLSNINATESGSWWDGANWVTGLAGDGISVQGSIYQTTIHSCQTSYCGRYGLSLIDSVGTQVTGFSSADDLGGAVYLSNTTDCDIMGMTQDEGGTPGPLVTLDQATTVRNRVIIRAQQSKQPSPAIVMTHGATTAGNKVIVSNASGGPAGPDSIATLVAGTQAVADTNVTANSRITPIRTTAGGTLGHLSVALTAGAGYTVNSSSNTDTSTVYCKVESY